MLVFCALAVVAQPLPEPESISVMTFNIRYGTARDGENRWPNRREVVIETIRDAKPDILGVQEALSFQVEYLQGALPNHRRIGQGRGGGDHGEFSCLFVDTRRFRVERHADFWLSETPAIVASRGWDAALPRMCSWAVLHDRRTGGFLVVFNTHFDHRGEQARARAAELICAKRADFGGLPAVVMGDFNAAEDSAPLSSFRHAGFRDSFRVAHPDAEQVGTFNGFRGRRTGPKIDYVLCDDGFEVAAAAIDHAARDGRYASDHFAVSAELRQIEVAAPRLMPVLEGESWHISGRVDLGPLQGERQQAVDHALFRSDDGQWHVWSCVRGTAVGRVLYHWEGDYLEQPYWQPRGIAMRANPRAGESIDDWGGKEWIQAPFVLRRHGRHYLFFGGHRSELDSCQINLATSSTGRDFVRRRDHRGFSRLFVGPGEARDPMVIEVDGTYYCYYTGHDEGRRAPCKIYARESEDLIHWGDPVGVNWGGSAGDGNWSAECPFVIERDGYLYLFRTSRYAPPMTHVYRSTDPLDFGRGDDSKKIGTIAVSAPEIVCRDGDCFISSVHDLAGGIQLSRLKWQRDG